MAIRKIIIKILFLRPKIKSITKEMIKYIITIPVSGSRKVRTLGIRVITMVTIKIITSFKTVLLGYFLLK
jgi:hypothetical protein